MKTHFYTQDIIDICTEKHLTVDEIFAFVSQKHPTAGKSSIYRNVEELCAEWALKKVVGASKKTYFEKTKHDHIHLIDQETGEIFDIDFHELPKLNLPENFEIKDMDIKIFGTFKK